MTATSDAENAVGQQIVLRFLRRTLIRAAARDGRESVGADDLEGNAVRLFAGEPDVGRLRPGPR